MHVYLSVGVNGLIPEEAISTYCRFVNLPGKLSSQTVSLSKLQEILQSDQNSQILETFLTQQELQRFQHFRYPKRKLEWLGGRIAAKMAVANYCNIGQETKKTDWHSWEVVPDSQGKPFIKSVGKFAIGDMPHISLSHSGNIAVAMASSYPCGIDFQEKTATVLKVQNRFCLPEEAALLQNTSSLCDQDDMARLTLLWAAKEAVRKAVAISPLLGFKEIQLHRLDEKLPLGTIMHFKIGRKLSDKSATGQSENCFTELSAPDILQVFTIYTCNAAIAFTISI